MKSIKNIFAVFAAAAMMCSTFSGVCYAADKTETSVTDEKNLSGKQIEITSLTDKFLDHPIITDDGTIYAIGKKNSKNYILAIDNDGNIMAKTAIDDYANAVLKQSGDNIIFIRNGYEEPDINIDYSNSVNGYVSLTAEQGPAFQMAIKNLYLTVYDKDLNKISENNITEFTKKKSSQYADANSSMLVYTKGGKLYTLDHDGKNKKVILDLADTEYSDCSIAALAVNESYAGLLITNHYDKHYAAAVDLETGKTKLKKLSGQILPKAENGLITWTYYDFLDYNAGKKEYNSSKITNTYFKDGKFVTEQFYDKDKFTSILTCTDSSGRTFSQALDKSTNIYTINMTENGKTVKITDIEADKLSPADAVQTIVDIGAANSGIIMIEYTWYKNNNYTGGKNGLMLIPYETE